MRPESKASNVSEGGYNLSDGEMASALEGYGVVASPGLLTSIRSYLDVLLAWNRKINLTRIVQPLEILERHFGEAFFAAAAVPITQGRLVDIGSGAGFPALGIKLVARDLSVTLVEANLKKATFLLEVCRALNLKDVQVERCRFQDLALTEGSADYITARALGQLDEFLGWAAHALNPGGRIVLWLGVKDATEVAKTPGWRWQEAIVVPKSRERVLLAGYKPSPDLA